ncbi:MAG: hypothetical protein ACE5I4_02700 [Thermoplasmata archaeon]
MKARNLLVPVYALGVFGALLQLTGGIWDVSWHILGIVETFFTPPHLVLYTGIGLVLFAAVVGIYVRFRGFARGAADRFLLTGLLIALVGGGLQVAAGPFDFWWHENFGFDPFLFTPPHAILIVGVALAGIGMGVGAVRVLQAQRAGLDLGAFRITRRRLHVLAVVGLTTLWLGLNGLVYLLADVGGIAYTFGLGEPFLVQAALPAFILATSFLGLTGTLVFLSAKRILGWRGAATAVAVLGAAIVAAASLGFQAANDPENGAVIAAFIPLYLAFLLPVALFDFLVKDLRSWWTTLVAAVLLAPFASYLDGFYSLGFWIDFPQSIPFLLIPMFLMGLVAGLTQLRFSESLLSREMASTA